jgi:hypothetical protein
VLNLRILNGSAQSVIVVEPASTLATPRHCDFENAISSLFILRELALCLSLAFSLPIQSMEPRDWLIRLRPDKSTKEIEMQSALIAQFAAATNSSKGLRLIAHVIL